MRIIETPFRNYRAIMNYDDYKEDPAFSKSSCPETENGFLVVLRN